MQTFHILKHYFDFISTDKSILLYVYFIQAEILGKRRGIVEIHGKVTGGKEVKYSKSYNGFGYLFNGGMAIGSNLLEHNCNSFRININIDNIKLNLVYQSVGTPWKATNDAVVLKNNHNKFIKWLVEQPSSNISGILSINNSVEKICGHGYHDIVEMNIPPWKTPIKRLYWGRAQLGTYSVVYNFIDSGKGKVQKYLMLQQNGINITRPGSFNIIESENGTEITGTNLCLKLKHLENIEDSKIVNQNRISSALVRFFLSHTGGKPVEKKYYSSAQLIYENKVYSGDAIHELVLWNGGN